MAPMPTKLTIFVVDGIGDVRRSMSSGSRNVAGYYRPSIWGSIAVVPRRADNGEFELDAETVLFHEYAHHFMLQYSRSGYPAWYVEGFAEYFSTVDFRRDGSVAVGSPAKHRFYGIATLPAFPLVRMFSPELGKMGPDQTEAFYGWSWLLTHYLRFAPDRKGQVNTYLKQFSEGVPPMQAAVAAFGPISILQKDIEKYRDARTLSFVKVVGFKFADNKVDVVTLPPAQSALVPFYFRFMQGSNGPAEVAKFLADVQPLAARFPDEPMALELLAEGALDARQFDDAEKANSALLAKRPQDARALIRAARIAEARLGEKGDPAQWKSVRSLIVKANRVAPDDPIPLWEFYRWFEKSGTRPIPAVAIDGLRKAQILAPQSADVRFALARELIAGGKRDEAKITLAPVLNDPHSAEMREAARAMLAGDDKPVADTKKEN